ncbi:hypothetical protein ASG88_13495 [Nocardioides sp. Soil777]|uniref:hypothetical protein n=1 Tax=Nocardioides sp. Soil777 TaxID=1736409 RepID=UPI0007029191|nr:hypothetical protein [Nocardioides sp. Soil777]KRE99628.1 hypothetical protein ASG88_13495 [Nocardioides sp. Soil777]
MESFLVLILVAVVAIVVLYGIIRLAVSHGVQDAARSLQPASGVGQVSEVIRRQRARYGDEQV